MDIRAATFSLIMALAVSPTAVLAKQASERALTAQTPEQFELQANAVRTQMQPGGHFESVKPAERITVEQRLDEIGQLIAKHSDPAQFTDAEKAQLLMAQEDVNAILTHNDGRRLVCERRAPTGSHLGKDRCRTVSEIERERRETQKNIGDRQKQPSGRSGLPAKQGD